MSFAWPSVDWANQQHPILLPGNPSMWIPVTGDSRGAVVFFLGGGRWHAFMARTGRPNCQLQIALNKSSFEFIVIKHEKKSMYCVYISIWYVKIYVDCKWLIYSSYTRFIKFCRGRLWWAVKLSNFSSVTLKNICSQPNPHVFLHWRNFA